MASVRIIRSTVIEAPADRVWHLLRDFNAHRSWHPAIAASHIEADGQSDKVGAVRAFTLRDGAFLREQLIALSDHDRSLTYCLLEAPIPLIDYVATMRVRPITDGDWSFVHWQSSFAPPADRAAELAHLVAEDIYEAGFKALKERFRAEIA
jgi:NADPH2:quinone reductase